MKIPCQDIATVIEQSLRREVDTLKEKGVQPKLVTFLLEPTPEQQSFVSIKERVGKKLGIEFELVTPHAIPNQDELLQIIEKKAQDPKTTGIIIQLPLPSHIQKDKLYSVIPTSKEIEGHISNSHFQFPLSLAVLTGIKYIYSSKQRHPALDLPTVRQVSVSQMNDKMLKQVQHDDDISRNVVVDFGTDAPFFKAVLSDKNIVIAGRGPTGGEPIGKAFDTLGISYQMTHSSTQNVDEIYKQADIIIAATGKKIINKNNIKKGVVLLNVGLRKENGELKGDYNESEIHDIASYYTETPGGLGPLDVLYLYKNVIDAATPNVISKEE